MALTLTLADSADGTGGTATIAGVVSGAAVTLYRSAWTGAMGSYSWSSSGTRTGPGTIAVTPGNGYYLWQATSLVTGTMEVGPLVYQNLTDAAQQAYHYQILEAVRLGVISLNLSGINSVKVMTRWLPRAWEGVDNPPEVFVVPVGREEYRRVLTNVDDPGYPVGVVLIDKLQMDASANMNRDLLWRQKVQTLFRFQHLQGVAACYDCNIIPDVIIDPAAWAKGYLVSTQLFQFFHRQIRGLT